MLHVCLDVCCLNRPFDDQRQDRIRLETEAVLLILEHCDAGEWQWISSAVVEEEIDNTPNHERWHRVRHMLTGAHVTVELAASDVERAHALKALGFRTYDALHLACAEQAEVDVFLTTDDLVIRTATRHAEHMNVRVANPVDWLLEVREQ